MEKLIYCFCLLASFTISAQTFQEMSEAFQKSYAFEAQAKYDASADALKKLPGDNYEVQLRLGWLYYLAGKWDLAQSHYKKASQFRPASLEPLLGLVNVNVAREEWNLVEQAYLSILKIDPKNVNANYQLGLIYYVRKNYTKALTYFSIYLNMYPFTYEAVQMSAWTHYFLGKNTEAKVLFQKCLLLRPNDPSALEGLSLIK